MTREDFQQQAEALCDTLSRVSCNENHALLNWRRDSVENTRYLVHAVAVRNSLVKVSSTAATEEEALEADSVLYEDEATTTALDSSQSFEWRFSIVYSDTWRVPVLYFTVQDASGNPCPRDQVLSMLPAASQQQDKWDFISYDEHPITGTPSYFLHPCQTQDLLELLHHGEKQSSTLLLSWLSMILPAIGFNLSSKTFQQLHQRLLGFDLQS